MAATKADTLATVQAIVITELNFVRISTPIIFALGNLGEILNIIIFLQRIFRTNSCAIYLLAASFTRLFFINFTILLTGLALGYGIDPSQTSLVFCKIKLYLSYVAAISPPSFVVLACFDRFMLSSLGRRARLWSQPRFAYRLVAGVIVFWMIFSIHGLIGSTIYYGPGYSYCFIESGSYALFQALYAIIINYLLPPILMIIFGVLTIINVRKTQRRIRPIGSSGYVQRKDRHLLRMLLFQILASVIFTIPGAAIQVYGIITVNWQKSLIWQSWEVFFLILALFLFYIPYCAGFYIYTLTASVFRQELKRMVMHYYRRFFPQRRPRIATLMIATT